MRETPSYLKRFGLRCALVYWTLYFFPAPLNVETLEVAWSRLWQPAVAAFGEHVVGIAQPISFEAGNSADRLCDYLSIGLFASIAVVAGLLGAWRTSTVERERQLFHVLHLYLRFALGFQMLVYGILKVFPAQFETPGPEALVTRLGDLHPTDLLWAFIGTSSFYQRFCGAAEVAGGLLLLWSRSAMLGALIIVAVMSNVVMFNLCYDVSVKQLSSHLLLAASFVLLPYARHLLAALLPDEPELALNLSERWSRRVRGVQGALIVWFAFVLINVVREEYTEGRLRPVPPEYGVWEVEAFDASDARAPWSRVLLERETFTVLSERAAPVKYAFALQRDTGTVTLKRDETSDEVLANLHADLDASQLTLEGALEGGNVQVTLRRRPGFRLLSTGFHLIQE